MGKFPTFFVLLVAAAFAAALFGALHNQLSYSVGPTYFTEFKFNQFRIGEGVPERLGAALVGVQASWWMGPLIGLPAFLYGLVAVPSARSYLAAGLGGIFVVILLATFGALAGLLGGLVADSTGLMDEWITFPDGPSRADLLRAGFMHDASYLAGALGGIAAFFPMRRARQIDNGLARKETAHAT
ncbi:hypothetical protein [Jannaschia sp. CCS1]|uniref:hypothetical protein n=1 Tax=Jannaschia sp. (strain CCS1) TaxID=290400 RepID=UPI000053CBDF|nr:hypothetical protein [Jannaschia sp. CCS1]ABD53692.1 conserved hypothetical protein-signal peptide and transmembrane prediction [Jannaschia sp. CCS1]